MVDYKKLMEDTGMDKKDIDQYRQAVAQCFVAAMWNGMNEDDEYETFINIISTSLVCCGFDAEEIIEAVNAFGEYVANYVEENSTEEDGDNVIDFSGILN